MEMHNLAADLADRRNRIVTEMGGPDKIARVHARGRLTGRERIDRMVDPGSFVEIGTFARSIRPEDHARTPGDGKITGLAKIDGRPVVVYVDDVTVMRGSGSVSSAKRVLRIFEHAIKNGHPVVHFGENGGARIPDTLGSEGFVTVWPHMEIPRRVRQVPYAVMVTGESFGGSSFQSAFSDFAVQVRGSCMAVTSPRVIEVATGEAIGYEALGGVDVHDKLTGQIDRIAEDEDDAIALTREFLSYLPSNAWSAPPRTDWDGRLDADPAMYDLVPLRRNRAYDMRRVVRRLTDDNKFFELKPGYGRSLLTGFGRMGGRTVGVLASQPLSYAGALNPQACDKGTAFICLCDSFNIPLVFLQDTPGFMVGRQVEHERLLSRAIRFIQALSLARVPRLTVVLRKAFGLAYFALSGSNMGGDLVAAWPSAELSFMDPAVGVNVVHGGKLAKMADGEAERARLVEEWSKDTGPEGAAGIMALDEIIDPAQTRPFLIRALERMEVVIPPQGKPKPLAYWPTCY